MSLQALQCLFILMYYSNLIFFQLKLVISLNYVSYILWTLHHKSHYPESHYHHSISNGIRIAESLFISYKFFLKKVEHFYPIHLKILPFV